MSETPALTSSVPKLDLKNLYISYTDRKGRTVQAVEDVGEVRLGEWEGTAIADLDAHEEWRRYNAFRMGVRVPGGELMIETQTRMVRALIDLAARHRDELVAVVSHGDPLRCAVAAFLGIPLDLLLRFEINPASVSVLEIGPWGSRVLCVNHTGETPL